VIDWNRNFKLQPKPNIRQHCQYLIFSFGRIFGLYCRILPNSIIFGQKHIFSSFSRLNRFLSMLFFTYLFFGITRTHLFIFWNNADKLTKIFACGIPRPTLRTQASGCGNTLRYFIFFFLWNCSACNYSLQQVRIVVGRGLIHFCPKKRDTLHLLLRPY
jgi:hypothetical protein